MAKKIVIAEDEEHIGKLILFKLKKEGFEISWETDGKAALETIQKTVPDLVILDVMMPKMNGFEVLKAVKSDDSLKHIPVVMLTAMGQESNIVSAIDAGAADYIVKPFRPNELLVRIKRLLPS